MFRLLQLLTRYYSSLFSSVDQWGDFMRMLWSRVWRQEADGDKTTLVTVREFITVVRNRQCLTKHLDRCDDNMNGIIDAFRQSLMAVERKPSEANDGFNRLEFYFVNQQLVQRPVDQWQRFVAAQGRKVHLTFLKLQLALALALASVDDWYFRRRETAVPCEEVKRFGVVVLMAASDGKHCTCDDCKFVWGVFGGLRGVVDEKAYGAWVVAEWEKCLNFSSITPQREVQRLPQVDPGLLAQSMVGF